MNFKPFLSFFIIVAMSICGSQGQTENENELNPVEEKPTMVCNSMEISSKKHEGWFVVNISGWKNFAKVDKRARMMGSASPFSMGEMNLSLFSQDQVQGNWTVKAEKVGKMMMVKVEYNSTNAEMLASTNIKPSLVMTIGNNSQFIPEHRCTMKHAPNVNGSGFYANAMEMLHHNSNFNFSHSMQSPPFMNGSYHNFNFNNNQQFQYRHPQFQHQQNSDEPDSMDYSNKRIWRWAIPACKMMKIFRNENESENKNESSSSPSPILSDSEIKSVEPMTIWLKMEVSTTSVIRSANTACAPDSESQRMKMEEIITNYNNKNLTNMIQNKMYNPFSSPSTFTGRFMG